MAQDNLTPLLSERFGYPIGDIDRTVPSARAAHGDREMAFEFAAIAGDQIPGKIDDPADRLLDLFLTIEPFSNRFIVTGQPSEFLDEVGIRQETDIEDEARC